MTVPPGLNLLTRVIHKTDRDWSPNALAIRLIKLCDFEYMVLVFFLWGKELFVVDNNVQSRVQEALDAPQLIIQDFHLLRFKRLDYLNSLRDIVRMLPQLKVFIEGVLKVNLDEIRFFYHYWRQSRAFNDLDSPLVICYVCIITFFTINCEVNSGARHALCDPSMSLSGPLGISGIRSKLSVWTHRISIPVVPVDPNCLFRCVVERKRHFLAATARFVDLFDCFLDGLGQINWGSDNFFFFDFDNLVVLIKTRNVNFLSICSKLSRCVDSCCTPGMSCVCVHSTTFTWL